MKLIQLTEYSPKLDVEDEELDVNVDHIRWFKPFLNRTVMRLGDDLIHVTEDADIIRRMIDLIHCCDICARPYLVRDAEGG